MTLYQFVTPLTHPDISAPCCHPCAPWPSHFPPALPSLPLPPPPQYLLAARPFASLLTLIAELLPGVLELALFVAAMTQRAHPAPATATALLYMLLVQASLLALTEALRCGQLLLFFIRGNPIPAAAAPAPPPVVRAPPPPPPPRQRPPSPLQEPFPEPAGWSITPASPPLPPTPPPPLLLVSVPMSVATPTAAPTFDRQPSVRRVLIRSGSVSATEAAIAAFQNGRSSAATAPAPIRNLHRSGSVSATDAAIAAFALLRPTGRVAPVTAAPPAQSLPQNELYASDVRGQKTQALADRDYSSQ